MEGGLLLIRIIIYTLPQRRAHFVAALLLVPQPPQFQEWPEEQKQYFNFKYKN